jgi:hypothetical protein
MTTASTFTVGQSLGKSAELSRAVPSPVRAMAGTTLTTEAPPPT